MARPGKEWSPRETPVPFRKGNVIVPEGGKYPEDALEVIEVVDDRTFRAAPVGGGSVYKFGPRQTAKYRFRFVQPDEMKAKWRKGRFSMDFLGDKSVEGWTTGDLWNGWATPFFEKEAAEEVLREAAETYAEMGETYKWGFDPEGDAFTFQSPHDEEPDRVKGERITTPDGRKKVYGIGAYSWTWTGD